MNLLPAEITLNIYDDIISAIEEKSGLLDKVISLKRLFARIFSELTLKEDIAFSGLQSKIEYISAVHDFDSDVIEKISRIKSFIYRTVNKKIEFGKSDFLALASEIISLVAYISGEPVPEPLLKIIDNHSPVISKKEPVPADEFISDIKCIILNVSAVKSEEKGREHFSLLCESVDEDFRFWLRVNSYNFEDFRTLKNNLKRYMTLRILNIKAFNKERHIYGSEKNTQIVIEPDFLIEASEIAECFSGYSVNSNIFFVRKLIPSVIGENAFKGTLVNGLMDKLIINAGINPADALLELINTNPLKACSLGSQSITALIEDILSTHYKNLIKIFSERKHSNIKIEPSFISPVYGISGRLDALIIPESDGSHKNIFELKSGKPHSGKGIWPNNKMQLVCYNLLMKSTYGPERKGTTSVLYSAAVNSPFRAVSVTVNDEKRVLSVRNEIVSEILRLRQNKFDILNKFYHGDLGVVPPFSKNDVIEFSTLLKEANTLESKYYRYNLAFALREYVASKINSSRLSVFSKNGFSSLWLESPEEKQKDYNIINNLELVNYFQADDSFEFIIPDSAEHNFRDGDFVVMYKKTDGIPDPLKTELFRGKIKSISQHTLVIELHSKQLDYSYYSKGSLWVLEHDIVESNVWTTIQSLYDFLRAPKTRKELILGLAEPKFNDIEYIEDSNLSKDQNDNIKNAVSAKDYFLLQGPPGSGKTSTALIGIVKNLIKLYKPDDRKIVILAYTNRAVEEICSKLDLNDINFLKIGGKSINETYDIGSAFNLNNLDIIRETIAEKDVYVSTVSSFYSKIPDLKEIADLDTVIIDEASQLTEYAVSGILCNFKKFIMIGDQNQLPAVVTQDSTTSEILDADLNSVGIKNLGQSLFERLYQRCKYNGWKNAVGMLQTHYRLHKDISLLINRIYYNQLISGTEEQVSDFKIFNPDSKNKIEILLSGSRLIFIESAFERASKTNFSEASAVNKILEAIKLAFGKNFTEKTVGVVTPWRAQIALIRKQITNPEIKDKVTIDTVERFQGSERDIIINSFAVHNIYQLKNLESFNNEDVDRKLLVSISRGSKQLIILGNKKVLLEGRYYREIIEHIKERGITLNQKQRKDLFGI